MGVFGKDGVAITEELAINALKAHLLKTLPGVLEEIEAEQQTTKLQLPMFKHMVDEYVDPDDIFDFPFAAIFVSESEDDVKDRALDKNSCNVRLMSVLVGKKTTLKAYRYHNAIREAIQRDRTLGKMGCRARVLSRKYYTPVFKGDEEIRVAESYIEITMEVQRR